MKQVLRTNNPVELSWAQSMLKGAGIEAVIFDTHASLIEGSITAIEKRLMVMDDDYDTSIDILKNAEPLAESSKGVYE